MDKLGKILHSAGKRAFKLVKLPSLKGICWKLTKIYLLKVMKFLRRLYGGWGGGTNFGGHRVCKQKSVTFRNFADLYRRTEDVSLSNLAPLLILWGSFQWCRQIFPNWSMSKVEKPWRQLLCSLRRVCSNFILRIICYSSSEARE